MAVTTKILFPATSNSSTTDFSLSGLQLNNHDDLDVYVTKTTAGIAANNNKRILHFRQSTSSNVDANHNQVNNTDGLSFPAITHTGGTETLENYTLVNNNGTVRFNSALPSGAIVFVERRTRDADSAYTSFASGSTIRATDLNNSSTESNFTAQEARNKALTIEGVLFRGDQPSTNFVTSSHIVNGTIVEDDIANSAITSNKIADNAVTTTEINNGAITTQKIGAGQVTLDKLADNSINTNRIIDGNVTRVKLEADIIDSTKLADNAVNSEHYVDGSIDNAHIADNQITQNLMADNSVGTNEIINNSVTDAEIATGTLDNRYFTETELTNGALDGRYFTETESDARYFNISSGETITSGDTFPDNDNTIATTKAINARIIDLIDDVGGFDIIQSEQHFPNTNPQGTTGQAAVLSIKAASTNLVPSGTTVTISNGNLANNANIIITGVTATIPTGFGFLVESTSTTHTYAFHRLVPKATEVTTVASNITNINNAANNETNINAAVSNASNINAAVSNASNITAVAGNASNINAAVSNASNINAAVSNASNITTTASNITNVNNVGNNVTNVNSVSNSAGANQTFTVTVQNVSGNKYFVDGVQTPVLKLARGKTYTFDQSDSSNSSHPLRFRDSSDNAYTSGVTSSGLQGSSGATVTFVVPSNAPSSLKYYCTAHGNSMGNTITVIDDNVGIVAGSISNVNTVGGSISNVNTTAGSISNVNTVATNINAINDFTDVYRVGSQNPTNHLTIGDLFFNTTSNSLKVYTGSAWVDGVTATGNFAVVTGNTFTGSNNHNDNVKSIYGTGSDLEIFHQSNNSYINDTSSGYLYIQGNDIVLRSAGQENMLLGTANGAVSLYFDNSKKFETTSVGAQVTGNLSFGDNGKASFGASGDLQIFHNGSNSLINDLGTGGVIIAASKTNIMNAAASENMAVFNDNGSVELYHDGTKKSQTDSAGTIFLDDIFLGDNLKANFGASEDLQIYHDGSDTRITNTTGALQITGNNDFRLKTNGGQNIFKATGNAVELYYDTGSGGSSKKLETTSNGVDVSGDLASTGNVTINNVAPTLYFTDSDADDYLLQANGGSFIIYDATANATRLQVNDDGSVDIHAHCDINQGLDVTGNITVTGTVDGVDIAALNTTVGNITTDVVSDTSPQLGGDLDINNYNVLFGDSTNANNDRLKFGAGNDLEIYHDGNNSFIKDAGTGRLSIVTSQLQITNAADSEVMIKATQDDAVELYHNGSKKLETASTGIQLDGKLFFSGTGQKIDLIDNQEIRIGTGDDLRIYHDGTNSIIKGNQGQTRLVQDYFAVRNGADNEYMIYGQADSTVQLYYNGSVKLETNNEGVRVEGYLEMLDNQRIQMGNGDDLQLWHDGTNSTLYNGTGSLFLRSNTIKLRRADGNEDFAEFFDSGSARLYYDNSKKLETTSSGIDIVGGAIATGNSAQFRAIESGGSTVKIQCGGQEGYIGTVTNHKVSFISNDTRRWTLENSGHILPYLNNTYDIGSTSYRVRNIYTNDLHLSNEGHQNDVDGTWGDWTIQEGESDLFLKNNRSGKKYKFNLMEVS